MQRIPIETLGNIWYFRHGRKSCTLYQISTISWNFQYLVIVVEFSLFGENAEITLFRLLQVWLDWKFTEMENISIILLFFGNSRFSIRNSTFSRKSWFPSISEISSITRGFYRLWGLFFIKIKISKKIAILVKSTFR